LKAELGGPPLSKWVSAIFLVMLWVIYVVFSSIMAYNPDAFV